MGTDVDRFADADLAGHASVLNDALAELEERHAVPRLWEHDPALWKPEPSEQSEITDRLGWLVLPESMPARLPELRSFADQVAADGIRHVVLCGMGGSSLAPEVFRITFGSRGGRPRLIVLDSTDPGAVSKVDGEIDPSRTLFLISSKSGGTLEVMSFLAHFWNAAEGRGSQFAAITDPGTSLEQLARERGFRATFLNPPDIGGRYSALSLFGLVPGALIGMDLEQLLDRARAEAAACAKGTPARQNPGAWLGAFMGGFARAGRDKLTVLTSPGLASFGLWVEQLLAESTGKEGRGIVPIVGEPIGTPGHYGSDRAFVCLRLDGDDNAELDRAIAGLRGRQPLATSRVSSREDLGPEMYRWEVGTALAGALLGINAFDQPNVQESKDNTSRVLREAISSGHLGAAPSGQSVDVSDRGAIARLLGEAAEGDYVAIQAYVTPTSEVEQALQQFRAGVRDARRAATTLGFGPRFLHSTGQLHKGGPATGVFLQLTYEPSADVPIPGQPYGFRTLLAAQALGDLLSLSSRGLRVLRVNLGSDLNGGVRQLAQALGALPAAA